MAALPGVPLKSVFILCVQVALCVCKQVEKYVVTTYLCLCWCKFCQWSTLSNLKWRLSF